jgi:multidrug resistance efflux pump
MNLARLTLFVCMALAECRKEAVEDHPHGEAPPPTNRIAVPAPVRKNLGIEFVKVERRRVAQTLRLPGHFELLPAARHEHRVPMAGRVEVLVQPLQSVKEGEVLYRLDSPDWRRVQKEIGELATAVQVAEAHIEALQPLVAAHGVHEESLRKAVSVMEARIQNLEEARASVGGQAPELAAAKVQLAQVRAELAEAAEKRAETEALLGQLRADAAAGRDRQDLALDAAATLLSVPAASLKAAAAGSRPVWRELAAIEGRAIAGGIVDKLPVAHGAWVAAGDLVLTITDVSLVRFRARGLQSDLPRLQAGLPARVVLPQGNDGTQEALGALALGVEADPAQRTVDLFLKPDKVAAWARPGLAAFLEVETLGGRESELAIPLSAALQDGLQRVFFRRDPADPDQVIRVEADLGIDDGRWVEVKSGIRDGDEVVLAGAYELMLASSGSAPKGGHFHADGTFHEGKDK